MKYKKEIEEVIDVIVDLAQSHSKQNAKDFLEYHQAVKELQALIDRAVRESKKDTERLDFLDRCNMALNKHYGTTYGWELILNHNVNRLMAGNLKRIDLNDSAVTKDSCRDAIDKAISHLTDSEK